MHLLHSVSHVDHHVVEHAEGVPHVLSKHKKASQEEEGLNGWAHTPHVHKDLSACKQLHHMYKHTCADYNTLNAYVYVCHLGHRHIHIFVVRLLSVSCMAVLQYIGN